jgi:hypothetical protein
LPPLGNRLCAELAAEVADQCDENKAFASVSRLVERAFRRSSSAILACQGQLAPAFVIEHDIMKAQGCNYWRELCIAAAFEDNPERLPEIVAEINSQLPERQEDLVTRAFESLATGFPPPQGKHWIQ